MNLKLEVSANLEVAMCRIRFVILGIALALQSGSTNSHLADDGATRDSLEGDWEIVSVQRDGRPDALQVGARITFTGHEVTFQPKVEQFVDGTS